MTAVAHTIEDVGIVPVITIDDPGHAVDLAHALSEGGIRCAEFTLRTPAGLEAIQRASTVSDFVAGAGTVLTVEQADAAIESGAQFVVSPGYDADVSQHVRELDVLMVPGIATPTELQHARAAGFDRVKVFPVGNLGGPIHLDQLSAPFGDVGFLPSGGVTRENLDDYLAMESVFAVSGSWMATRHQIAKGEFTAISEQCRDACSVRDRVRRSTK